MKTYKKPISVIYEVTSEGIIASSLPFNETPGNQQLSVRREGWNAEDWSSAENENDL